MAEIHLEEGAAVVKSEELAQEPLIIKITVYPADTWSAASFIIKGDQEYERFLTFIAETFHNPRLQL